MYDSNETYSSNPLSISIIIPTMGRKKEVIWTLESLYTLGFADGPNDFETIIIEQPLENGEYSFPNEEIGELKAKFPNLRWFHCNVANLPLARMVGLENCRGKSVLYLDD
ncbi:MAG: glycosyltransferase family A protein, partial [Proteobacteria bacterium]|nr:glycosyltransferase family A protein [Pseudomonadota bacterium]